MSTTPPPPDGDDSGAEWAILDTAERVLIVQVFGSWAVSHRGDVLYIRLDADRSGKISKSPFLSISADRLTERDWIAWHLIHQKGRTDDFLRALYSAAEIIGHKLTVLITK